MIRRRAVLDTVNPPGQARYLRDVIMRIQDEDRTKAESAEVLSDEAIRKIAVEHFGRNTLQWLEGSALSFARAVLNAQGLDK